jgi:hypothetical protein
VNSPVPTVVTIDPASIDAIVEGTARRMAELLGREGPIWRDGEVGAPDVGDLGGAGRPAVGPRGRSLLTAAQVARELQVSRSWVYQHAEELGARRLGDGPRGRLRFDLETVRAAGACLASKQSQARDASAGAESDASPVPRTRQLPNGLPKPGSVLGIRPR